MNMFCYQCEQTAQQTGCTATGVCGKDPEVAALQDLLLYAVKDISRYAHRCYELGLRDRQVDVFTVKALYSTLTNVNFDPDRFMQFIRLAVTIKDKAEKLYEITEKENHQTPEFLECPVKWWAQTDDIDKMISKGETLCIQHRIDKMGTDITSLQEILTYGIKGMAAYTDHAQILGAEDKAIYEFIHKALDYLSRAPINEDELLYLIFKCGQMNLRTMELLDEMHTAAYGFPEPTNVKISHIAGKCIAVSGHDLKDLEDILKMTAGNDIKVYTHGEMLACNAYPGLNKYDHLVGHYGGPWQDQRQDFEKFPGSILMTTNCLQKPRNTYKHRLFTSGVVGFPGVTHISNSDFAPVIEAALDEKGFAEDEPEKFIMTGFAHNAVLSIADKIVDLVKQGRIRHFFLIGGCDGATPGRNYYTEIARKVPDDCMILTLACGKFRFNKRQFGEIAGIPRLLDCGQCNDAYSAIQIAKGLAHAFNCGVNELPLSFVVSWFEQKAVAILLTLLHLGIKGIYLGPTLPAFISPNILNILTEKFDLKPITNPQKDLEQMLNLIRT